MVKSFLILNIGDFYAIISNWLVNSNWHSSSAHLKLISVYDNLEQGNLNLNNKIGGGQNDQFELVI